MPMARVGAGIRSRPCHAQDVCADCCSLDPEWASINRGILICDECCSVHRSLGRHISHVKSLIKGSWHPSELAMVHSLSSSGANHIWEHTLLDPSNVKSMRRKPQAKEPVHPNKADFIRAKHQMMSFVYKPSKEDISAADKDVSCQLHASVRTHNLEISLRLLSQGADPNYFHKEKGNSPLHVAARAGQESQVELLAIYGADPGAPDRDGKTPVDYAREGGFHDIAVRLIELQYELPDRLAFYLCGYKPDHNNGQHWVIPQMADTTESQAVAKEARARLISLPNHSFEELACDVYDEVDRRETDAIFLPTQNQSALLSDRCSVPFLPVNPEFSSVRNQGRQKLARFNDREFATLIIDILIEIRRKMIGHSYVLETDKATFADKLDDFTVFNSSCMLALPTFGDSFSTNYIGDGIDLSTLNPSMEEVNKTVSNPLYASYDQVYISSDDERRELDSDSLEKSGSSRNEGKINSSYDEEKLGEGCMSDLFTGRWSPILSRKSRRRKLHKKKRQKRGVKSSSGVSSDSDELYSSCSNARNSTSTNFSLQVSKLLGSKASWAFGDYHPKKLNIVHPPLRCDTLPTYLQRSSNISSRSRLVHTLTLPLKLANQKNQSWSKVLSRSQPTYPELIRKFLTPNNNFSRSEPARQLMKGSSMRKCSLPIKSHVFQSELYFSNQHPRTMNVSRNLYGQRSSHVTSSYTGVRKDHPFPPVPSSSLQLSDKPILEVCPTCAYNVTANLQHPSIWGESINFDTGIKFNGDGNKASCIKTRASKDECKIQ